MPESLHALLFAHTDPKKWLCVWKPKRFNSLPSSSGDPCLFLICKHIEGQRKRDKDKYLYKSFGVTCINVKSNGKHTSETERVIPKDSVHDSNNHHPVTWSAECMMLKKEKQKVWGSQESLKDSLMMKDSMPECYRSVWGSRGKNQRSQNNFESLIFFLRRRIHSGKDPSHVADPRSVECFREIMARNVPAVNSAICWAAVVKYWNVQHTNIDIYP